MSKIDRTITFEEELYRWLQEYVPTIRPETTIPKFINWLVEKERDRKKVGEFVQAIEKVAKARQND